MVKHNIFWTIWCLLFGITVCAFIWPRGADSTLKMASQNGILPAVVALVASFMLILSMMIIEDITVRKAIVYAWKGLAVAWVATLVIAVSFYGLQLFVTPTSDPTINMLWVSGSYWVAGSVIIDTFRDARKIIKEESNEQQ